MAMKEKRERETREINKTPEFISFSRVLFISRVSLSLLVIGPKNHHKTDRIGEPYFQPQITSPQPAIIPTQMPQP
jgi:hypothetical protein